MEKNDSVRGCKSFKEEMRGKGGDGGKMKNVEFEEKIEDSPMRKMNKKEFFCRRSTFALYIPNIRQSFLVQ